MSEDPNIFSKNWHLIVTAAQMCRVQKPPVDADTMVIPKEVFDDLVRLAQIATDIQCALRPAAELVVHHRKDCFDVTVFDPLTTPFTVTERTLFEALSAARAKLGSVISDYLR